MLVFLGIYSTSEPNIINFTSKKIIKKLTTSNRLLNFIFLDLPFPEKICAQQLLTELSHHWPLQRLPTMGNITNQLFRNTYIIIITSNTQNGHAVAFQ